VLLSITLSLYCLVLAGTVLQISVHQHEKHLIISVITVCHSRLYHCDCDYDYDYYVLSCAIVLVYCLCTVCMFRVVQKNGTKFMAP